VNRNTLTLLAPPAAVARQGGASYTVAPIGVFWLTSLVAIVYGLSGGTLGGLEASSGFIVALGFVMWAIAAVWARLVISGIEEDRDENRDGPADHRVVPRLNEPDPFKELPKGH
jgi:hypothetical protein